MIPASDIRKGTILEMDGSTYRVINTQYNNPGRGAASMRAQLMDLNTGATQYRVFTAEESLNNLFVETESVKYLYGDNDLLHFMNNETFDQYDVNRSLFGDNALYLKDDMDLQLMTTEGSRVIDYQLPTTMTYTVVEAEVAVVGNTSGAVTKKVKTETGLSVTVPNFISEGEQIKVDTRDGSYVGRG
jgi:elongation factor P